MHIYVDAGSVSIITGSPEKKEAKKKLMSRLKTIIIISVASLCTYAFLLGNSFGSTPDKDRKVLFDVKKSAEALSVHLKQCCLSLKKSLSICAVDNPRYGREENGH